MTSYSLKYHHEFALENYQKYIQTINSTNLVRVMCAHCLWVKMYVDSH